MLFYKNVLEELNQFNQFYVNVLTETTRYEWSYEEGWGDWKTIESPLAFVGILMCPSYFFFAATRGIFASREGN